MDKILVLCEKTDQAKALKEGLGFNFETKKFANKFNKTKIPNLYYESEKVTIVAARGHLLSLCDVADYIDREVKSWNDIKDLLPFVPNTFKYKSNNDGWCYAQLLLISNLLNSGAYSVVYNFGDPDAEGELLIREILSDVKNTLPVKRIECKSLVPSVVADAFNNPHDSNRYNELYFEALARQQTDWLNGINLTTMLSLATNKTLQVGRVLVPIVRFVYDSDKAIENFVPTDSWGVNMKIRDVVIPSKDISFEYSDSKVDDFVNNLNKNETILISKVKKNKTLNPKKLYNTAKLLSDLNTKFKIDMKKGAEAMEKLYLNAFITYPRTDCEYLQSKEENQMKLIISTLAKIGLPVKFHNKSTVFNDKKCGGAGEGGHTAIVITEKLPLKADIDKFTDIERAVYSLIYNRTLSNFTDNAEIEETKFTFNNSGYDFCVSGNVVTKQGFLFFEPRNFVDLTSLNDLKENSVVDAKFEKVKKTTKAPPRANASRLLYYLQHPFSKTIKDGGEDEDEEFYEASKSGVTIGTGATMEAITTKAIQYEYFTENKNGYFISNKGKFLIDTLDALGVNILNAEKTIELNIIIKKVAKKVMSLEDNKENIKNNLFTVKEILDCANIKQYKPESLGECPLCKSDVVEMKNVYKCSNKNCNFVIFKEDKYFALMHKKMSATLVKEFLKKGEITVRNITGQSGKKYGAVFSGTVTEKGYVNWKRSKYLDSIKRK